MELRKSPRRRRRSAGTSWRGIGKVIHHHLALLTSSSTCPPAALKCRQRKKAWLAQLQAKVEYLTNENERLTSALVASREEIARLSALVGAASVGQPVPLPVSGNGNNMPVSAGVGVGPAVNGAGGPPVSVNVSLPPPGKSAVAMVGGGGRGYGY